MIAARWVGNGHVVGVITGLEGPLPGCEVVTRPTAIAGDISDTICRCRSLDRVLHRLQDQALPTPIAAAITWVAGNKRAVGPADLGGADNDAAGYVAIGID